MEKKTIGGFIAALRKANGMTQKDLAEHLNVSDKTVSRWERDDGAPDLAAIPAIAEIFGVTCDELLRGERKSPAARAKSTEEVLVDLAFCGYNEKQMLSVLEAYIRQKKEKADFDVIIDSVFSFLQNKYLDNETSVEALVKLMYRIGKLSELNSEEEEPWFTMRIFYSLYEDSEEGYIDKDGYLACLKSFIFEREYCSDFQIYKPVKQKKFKSPFMLLIVFTFFTALFMILKMFGVL